MKELIDSLTKNLNISGAQAEGGAAVLFKAAKDKMGGEEFSKLLGGVPGLGDLMKKVPASGSSGLGAMFGGLASAVGGNAGLIATIVSGFGKLGLRLKSDHRAAETRQHGGRIAGSAADVEHRVVRLDGGQLYEPRQHHGREQEASRRAVDRGKHFDALIHISQRPELARHEPLARHGAKGGQQARVGHFVGADLGFHHGEPPALEVDHLLPSPATDRDPVNELSWRLLPSARRGG